MDLFDSESILALTESKSTIIGVSDLESMASTDVIHYSHFNCNPNPRDYV